MMKRFIPAVFLLCCQIAAAQTISVAEVPGDVSVEECSMTTYSPDPDASAVILWEKCDESIEQDMLRGYLACRTSVTRRLKILKTSACGYANLVMNVNSLETLKDVVITTYNLKNGTIESVSTTKEDCFKERIDSENQQYTYYAKKVKAGSVVELSYTRIAPLRDGPHDFELQRPIPVNLVTYSLKTPSWMKSKKVLLNGENVDYKSITSSEGPRDVFRASDIPAFREEPLSYCPTQYMTSIHYELKTSDSYAEDWSEVARLFKESPVMTQLRARTPLRKAVREIAAKELDDQTRITHILALVFSKARWNCEVGVMPYDFDMIGNPEFGNSADLNSLAGAAFTEAGYTVTPVFIRLRSQGNLIPQSPSPDAFNTYVLHIRRTDAEDGIDAILDASNMNLHFNVLPDEFLVDRAFEVQPDGSYNWLDLTKLCRNISSWDAVALPKADGSMEAEVKLVNYNASSFSFKDRYGHSTDSLLVEQMKSLIDCGSMSRIEVSGFGEFSPASYLDVEYTKQCKVTEDGSIIVNPFITDFFPSRQFLAENRLLPLDFSYPETVNYSFRVAVPEGYEIAEIPGKVSIAADGVPAAVIIRCNVISNEAEGPSVSVALKFVNEALTVSPERYPALRAMWLQASGILAGSRIVFRKKD